MRTEMSGFVVQVIPDLGDIGFARIVFEVKSIVRFVSGFNMQRQVTEFGQIFFPRFQNHSRGKRLAFRPNRS